MAAKTEKVIEVNEQSLEKAVENKVKKLTKRQQEELAKSNFKSQSLNVIFDSQLLNDFYEKNRSLNYDNNEVLKVLLKRYLNGEINVTKKKISIDEYN